MSIESANVCSCLIWWDFHWCVFLYLHVYLHICCCSVSQACLTLCNPIDCSMPGLPVHHQLPEFTQTHVHWVGDPIQPSHPLSSLSPPALNLSQHQGLFKLVSYLHQVAKVLEFQLQHQSFQWTPRETVETMSDFIFGGSKITADGDCNHEIKRRLLLGRKVMTNLDSIFKSRDITLPTKVRLVKAMVFPVVMYGCESWTVKNAEHWRIDAFELWCWRRLLRVPWTERRFNQSILKEISPGCSLEGLILKLKLLATWCEELTHLKRSWCWERLKAGGEGDNRGWDS